MTAMRGIVLFGHGSRDPAWRAPIEAVAERIRLRAPDAVVACAYLELCQPTFEAAVSELVDQGIVTLRVVPMFLGMGRHAREDLPGLVQAAQQAHPQLHIEVLRAIGEHAQALDLFADLSVL
jgi:sirohydrochlorin cobaltochelatase